MKIINLILLVHLCLTLSVVNPPLVSAHEGINHGNAQHRRVDGFDVLIELYRLPHYNKQFGHVIGVQGTHVLMVRLLKNNQPVINTQVKSKLIGADRKTIGPEQGEFLKWRSFKDKSPHYVNGHTLLRKGKYTVILFFKVNNKVSQIAFEVAVH